MESHSEKLDKMLGTVQSIHKSKTNVLGESPRKAFRDQSLGTNFRRVFTCSHCGQKGHLRKFCFDLKRGPRKSHCKETKVAKIPISRDSHSSLI